MDRSLLLDLPVFLAVTRHGNMTRAAASLHTVQSNVTARIRRLEDQLGATLFVRGARSLYLTPEGEILMPLALRLEDLARDLENHFGHAAMPETGALRIGAIETFAASRLVGLIAAFTTKYPQVEVSVQTGGTDHLRKKIRQSELDIAFVSRRSHDTSLREEKVLDDELVVIAPRNLRSLKDLKKEPYSRLKIFVQRTGCSFTARLIDHLRDCGIPDKPTHMVGTLEGVIASVRAGGGVAVLPGSYLDGLPVRGDFRRISLPPAYRKLEIFLVLQRWNLPIRLLDAFVGSCLEEARRR